MFQDAVSDHLTLEAWRLVHELRHAEPARRVDLEYSERAALLLAPMTSGRDRAESAAPTTSRTRRRHGALADAVRVHLACSHVERTLPLAELARDVGASPFHLARVFRGVTGCSIHTYRTQLRLRSVLLQLPDCESLSELAIATGFASHSHLSDTFRNHFHQSPASARAQLRG